MSEFILTVGKKGEIYTTKKIRDAIGLRENGKVVLKIKEGIAILEPLPKIEEIISSKKYLKKINVDMIDELLEIEESDRET
jgi:looped-hinge helix DNA binding domain, AbrB family